jgi:hypothetical protein
MDNRRIRTCVLVFVNRIFAGIAREAIRSVSHPDLALDALMLGQFSNRKKPGQWPGLLPARFFLVNSFDKPDVLARASTFRRTRAAPIPPQAGPENFQCRAAFIQYQRAVVPESQQRRFLGPTLF